MVEMCFYNQKKFVCGDYCWTNFAQKCNREYRIGETCGMKLVNATELEKVQCRLCDKIDTKYRRRGTEMDRLNRWKREGGTLVASMDKSQNLVKSLEREIWELTKERDERRRSCKC